MHLSEQTVSIRLVWPVLRVSGTDRWLFDELERAGVSLRELANPDTRPRHAALMRLLEAAIARTGDLTLGLRAGFGYQPGDLDALEFAARSCATLRDAIGCVGRYTKLMHGAAEVSLEEIDDRAIWKIRITDGVTQPPVANDFAIAFAAAFARTHTGKTEPMLEVHLAHDDPSNLNEYVRLFGGEAKLGMPHNALVFRRAYLDSPMLQANAALQAAFELQAREQLGRVERSWGVRGKVRELVASQLRSGDTRMSLVAERMAMSVATLRRRLEDEGTSHTQILDDVRHELAKSYLRDSHLAISEVAFLLGFSHVAAFYKAFKRWTHGGTPASFRAGVERRAAS